MDIGAIAIGKRSKTCSHIEARDSDDESDISISIQSLDYHKDFLQAGFKAREIRQRMCSGYASESRFCVPPWAINPFRGRNLRLIAPARLFSGCVVVAFACFNN